MPFHNFGPSSIRAFFMDGSSETAYTMPLLSDSFFFFMFLTVRQDAIIALQSLIHTVCTPTGEALYGQGTFATPIACYHHGAVRDT